MIRKISNSVMLLVVLAVVSGGDLWAKPLPVLEKKPWKGCFVGHDTRVCQLTIDSVGRIEIKPKDERGECVGVGRSLRVDCLVEETLPGGKVINRKVQPLTLTTDNRPTDRPESVKYTGQVTGGGAFEVRVSVQRNTFHVGGRITGSGKSGNPLAFAIRTTMSGPYDSPNLLDKDFKSRIRRDEMRVERIGGKAEKLGFDATVGPATEEVNGREGLKAVRFTTDACRGRRFEFTAGDGGVIRLWNFRRQPLCNGFSIDWRTPAGQAARGDAALGIEVK